MHGLIIPIIVIVLILVSLALLKVFAAKGGAKGLPYEKEAALFTPAERSFLGVLDQAVGDEFRIMGKVRLGDVLKVKSGLDRAARQSAFNRIQSKHLDFVACDPNELTVQFVVELDDKSHERPDRQERDALVDQVMRAAGIPIIHFPVRKAYSIQELRDALVAALNSVSVSPEGNVPPASVAVSSKTPVAPPEAPGMDNPVESVSCPACGASMVRRKASRGPSTGNEF